MGETGGVPSAMSAFWFQQGLADVVGSLAGGDGVEGGADDAAVAADRVAAVAGGDLVGVEDVLAAPGVAGLELGGGDLLWNQDELVELDIVPPGGASRIAPSLRRGR